MKYGWLLVIVAIIVALNAPLIGRIAKNNKITRVVLVVICIVLLFTSVLLVVNSLKVL